MPEYQLQIKQVVDYPRCRIYREFIHKLINDRSIRINGGSGLFHFTVLCSYANFRTSYRRIDGISYTVSPGEWVCTVKELSCWFRTRFHRQALSMLDTLQKQHLISYTLLGRGNVVKYKILHWARHNSALEYNAPCQKDTGFFFLPVSVALELVSSARCSEMDIVLDLWVSAVYNDTQVQGSEVGPVNDLAATLRENKQHLYSYTSKQEIRESTVTDPETGEETTEPETWMVYTVRYNGESYFSDVVFQLTDDQKELAADYASNLSLFLGDGLLQNLEAWTGNSITSLGDVTFTDGITPVVYYNQLDERYAGKAYGTDNIGGYGCGPTAMAIVVSSLTDDMVDPMEMAEWSYNNGYWCKSSGSYHALIPAAAGEWGLPVSGCTTAEPQRITDALANGKLVVAIMSEGHFTSSGHFIVLRGVKDGKIMVADPASYTRSEQLWDLSIILNEASRRAGAGGPFWIIG